jgi:hypothetical protein
MNTEVARHVETPAAVLEKVVIGGDLSQLNPQERLRYYADVCSSVGLNPLTQPFEYITLNGKLRLYAKRDCTDQLRKIHSVSVKIVGRELIGGIYVVTAQATDKTSREDESTGAVNVSGKNGDDLANAYMKAETKAKRRVTLSICGLGLLDESEVADVDPEAPAPVSQQPRPVVVMPKAKSEMKDEQSLPQQPEAPKADPNKKLAAGQVKVVQKAIDRTDGKVKAEDLCAHFGVSAIPDLPFVKINDALAWITKQQPE